MGTEVHPEPHWDVLAPPDAARSTSLPNIYLSPGNDTLAPVRTRFVARVRTGSAIRLLASAAVGLGTMIVVSAVLSTLLRGSDPKAALVIGLPLIAAGILVAVVQTRLPRMSRPPKP